MIDKRQKVSEDKNSVFRDEKETSRINGGWMEERSRKDGGKIKDWLRIDVGWLKELWLIKRRRIVG